MLQAFALPEAPQRHELAVEEDVVLVSAHNGDPVLGESLDPLRLGERLPLRTESERPTPVAGL